MELKEPTLNWHYLRYPCAAIFSVLFLGEWHVLTGLNKLIKKGK